MKSGAAFVVLILVTTVPAQGDRPFEGRVHHEVRSPGGTVVGFLTLNVARPSSECRVLRFSGRYRVASGNSSCRTTAST